MMASTLALKKVFSRAGVVAAVTWTMTAAAIPATLTQQGRILTSDGEVVDGTLTMEFTIYDAAEEGTALWTETQSVTLDDGYFSTALGEETAIDPNIFDGSVRYLGVKVGTDDEMTPRQAIRSVPYALHAGTAESVAFGGLTGMPAACGTGQYLKGFTDAGSPICAAPTLSCRPRASGLTTGTSNHRGCSTGEVLTGGGCWTNGTLSASYHATCGHDGIFCTIPAPPNANAWTCETTSTVSIRAYARCCHIE